MTFACENLRRSLRRTAPHARAARAAEPGGGACRAMGLALSLALGSTACTPGIAGTRDRELGFDVVGDAAAPDLETLRARVEARLGAAQVVADVAVDEGASPHGGARVRVVVDEAFERTVREALAFRGGLDVHAAPRPTGDRAMTFEGALDVASHNPPGLVLPGGVARVDRALGGRALDVVLTADGAAKLAGFARQHPGETAIYAIARAPLGTSKLDDLAGAPDRLRLSFGDDLSAYAKAQRAARVLASPSLPPLAFVAATPLPVDRVVSTLCVALPFLISFAWLFFLRRFDRARPEPFWLVGATFALGGLAVVPAGLVEYALATATPLLDPRIMTLGGQWIGLAPALVAFTLSVGLAEECAKLFGVLAFARHRGEFDEPVDGIVYAGAASLGFAAVENVKYFALGRLSSVVIATRTFVTLPAHLFFGAIWGYALGASLVSKRPRTWAWVLAAALAHGAFDAFLSIDGAAPLALGLDLALAVLFIALLRRALRHGVVRPESAHLPEGVTEHVPAGAPVLFALSAFTMCVAGVALIALGAYFEASHRRVGPGFLALASLLLSTAFVAASGVARAMPLDVVLDPLGITFGGATRSWLSVYAVEAQGTRARGLVVRSHEGDIVLGPLSPDASTRLRARIDELRAGPSSSELR